jgi:hypothetical protein
VAKSHAAVKYLPANLEQQQNRIHGHENLFLFFEEVKILHGMKLVEDPHVSNLAAFVWIQY